MMGIIEHALDAAPLGGHRELWLATRPVVRRSVGRLTSRGADPRNILVVIADHSTVPAEVIQLVCPAVVIQVMDPMVAVLVGEQRSVVAAVLGGFKAYLARVPPGSFAVVTAPAGATPMISMSRIVDRRRLS